MLLRSLTRRSVSIGSKSGLQRILEKNHLLSCPLALTCLPSWRRARCALPAACQLCFKWPHSPTQHSVPPKSSPPLAASPMAAGSRLDRQCRRSQLPPRQLSPRPRSRPATLHWVPKQPVPFTHGSGHQSTSPTPSVSSFTTAYDPANLVASSSSSPPNILPCLLEPQLAALTPVTETPSPPSLTYTPCPPPPSLPPLLLITGALLHLPYLHLPSLLSATRTVLTLLPPLIEDPLTPR